MNIEIVDLKKDFFSSRLDKVLSRNPELDTELLATVSEIIAKVRQQGDKAVCELTESFDNFKVSPTELRIPEEKIRELALQNPPELINYIRQAIDNVRTFHEKQIEKSWYYTDEDDVTLGQRLTPLDSVGLYVPGGRAAYPSTVIMNAVPAIAAGVKRIAVTTPPTTLLSTPIIAATLKELGLIEVYGIGGAQAVAALAYGTESVRRVDKIVGPGNIYVAAAKKLVFGAVDIDSIAGPSEILVLADETADASFIAADLLSQAEHDTEAAAILITTSQELALKVQKELAQQLSELPRKEIAAQSIKNYGTIFLVKSMTQACELANRVAAEHLEIIAEDAETLAEKIPHAGAIFIGSYSCEAAGDYLAGPNHVLPTGGTARFSSPLGVYDFVKRTNIIKYSYKKLEKSVEAIAGLAECEGLSGHARAAKIRFSQK